MAELSGRGFTDARLRSVKNLDRTRSLALYDTSVTDAGIEVLRGNTCLEEVHITSDFLSDTFITILGTLPNIRSILIAKGPQITDQGVENLRQLSGLRELYLSGTQVTDRGLHYLSALKDLWSLCLDDTAVTDHGMESLASLKSLSLLSIQRTRVTGIGLGSLPNNMHFGLYMNETPASDEGVRIFASNLTNLKDLDLSGTMVSDISAKMLAGLGKLNVLRLANTSITDVTLAAFHAHRSLEALELSGTRVSECGVHELRKARRRLTVYFP